jgi:hypothetical protein
MSKNILITHNDLDGVGCAVLFVALMQDLERDYEYYFEAYRTVNERILKILNDYQDQDISIMITDISPSQQVAETLDKSGRTIRLIDHHKTATWLNIYPWAIINVRYCATKLLYDYLKIMWNGIVMYKDFVECVNDYDLWIHNIKYSKMLNILLNFLGHDLFLSRFLDDPSPYPNLTEEIIIRAEENRRDRYIEQVVKKAKVIDETHVFAIADRYKSELGEKLLELAPVAVILDPLNDTVSLRSRDKNYDVSKIAQSCGGGGHTLAAGFELLPGSILETLISYLDPFEKGRRQE